MKPHIKIPEGLDLNIKKKWKKTIINDSLESHKVSTLFQVLHQIRNHILINIY